MGFVEFIILQISRTAQMLSLAALQLPYEWNKLDAANMIHNPIHTGLGRFNDLC